MKPTILLVALIATGFLIYSSAFGQFDSRSKYYPISTGLGTNDYDGDGTNCISIVKNLDFTAYLDSIAEGILPPRQHIYQLQSEDHDSRLAECEQNEQSFASEGKSYWNWIKFEMDKENAMVDKGYNAYMCPAPDGTYGEYCP